MGKKEDFLERFMEFYDRIKGRKDVKSRVAVLADPPVLETMTVLSRGQADFIAYANWASGIPEWGGIFEGLPAYGKELMKTNISTKGGLGREQAIRFMASLSEAKILSKLGITTSGEGKEKK